MNGKEIAASCSWRALTPLTDGQLPYFYIDCKKCLSLVNGPLVIMKERHILAWHNTGIQHFARRGGGVWTSGKHREIYTNNIKRGFC